MWIILDAIILIIILICAAVSAHRGFVRTVIETVGFVAALLIAFSFGPKLAEFTYDKAIEPPVISAVTESTADTASDTVDAVWNALPSFITSNSDRLGVSKEKLSEQITDNTYEETAAVAESVSETVVRPIAVKIIGLIYSAIIAVVLLFVVKFAARLLNRVFSFSLVGRLNRFLGGLVGVVKGLVFAVIFCVLISLIVSFTSGGFLIFTHEAIDASHIFKSLTEIFI